MKVLLLHRDRDFEVKPESRDAMFDALMSGNQRAIETARRRKRVQARRSGSAVLPTPDDALERALELEVLWRAMAAGDEFVFEVVKRVVRSSLTDPDAIVYRQGVLADCLEQTEVVSRIYGLAVEALDGSYELGALWEGARPEAILHRSSQALKQHVDALKRLRRIAEEQADGFRSEGFVRLFAMLREELGDDYLNTLEHHLRELEFRRGLLESAALAKGNQGRSYVVHRPPPELGWRERLSLVGKRKPAEYSFELHPSEEAFGGIEEIWERGINPVANAVAQAAEHVNSFFSVLRLELAFYLGCVNLHRQLEEKGEPICRPEPRTASQPTLTARGIYDVCLTLQLENAVIRNDVSADGKSLVMITGANQGGKSTLLRSLGLAQVMMQSGMFVCAESFRAKVFASVFAHYKHEEDVTMERGKLDKELKWMSEIADRMTPGSMILFNESFASTNEREGSEVARQIVRALTDAGVTVIFVTHLYDLARSFYREQLSHALFLRAERLTDGSRSFRVIAGEPLPTSYGADSYHRVFGSDASLARSR